MQKVRHLIYVTLVIFCFVWISCGYKQAVRHVKTDENMRLDRLFVTFHDLSDTLRLEQKFRKYGWKVVDCQEHLKIARVTYDTLKVSPQYIFWRIKKAKETAHVEFDRQYLP